MITSVIAGWCRFCGFRSGVDFVLGDRQSGCEVEVDVAVKDWLDDDGLNDVDEVG